VHCLILSSGHRGSWVRVSAIFQVFSRGDLRADISRMLSHESVCYAPPVGKRAVSTGFVRPSVRPSICLSVRPVANNSRTQRPSVPKLGRKLPHLRCDSCTSFKVKKSKIKVTKPTDTHIVRHIFQMPRPMNFKLGIRMEDDDPHQPQTPWPPMSKVKVARSRDQSEPSWLYLCH